MTWFKVDDSFYDHPKVAQLPHAAVGPWMKAGAWFAGTTARLQQEVLEP